jgi:poly(A) polymerase
MIKLSEKELKDCFAASIFGEISAAADELGLECYVVGGYVRDLYLQRPSNDIDIVVVGSGINMAQALKRRLGRQAHVSVFKNFGTAQLKYRNIEIEFVGARKESYRSDSRKPIVEDGTLEDDQNRRDFTINTLAVCMNSARFGELVDPFNGIHDLQEKVVRTPLDPDITFSDDPLRMMRCVRFATQLNFYIDDEAFDSLCRQKERIKIISAERIIDELNKIILSPTPSKGFVDLERCGLLEIIFPELTALEGVETKNGVGHKDNFYHTLQVLDNISKHTDNLWLRWAALLHDVGKPRTKMWNGKNGWTFHNHNFIGGKMVPAIFERLKLPKNEKMKYVKKLVELHMRPIAIADDEVTDSAVRRLLFEAGDDIDDLMTLCEADITSKNNERRQRFLNNFQLVRQKLIDLEERDRIRNFQPPIKGEEIMQIFGLTPCQKVGALKSLIKDAILDGIIPNEYEPARRYMMEKAEKMGLKAIGN